MIRSRVLVAAAAASLAVAPLGHAQTCADPHYRWTAKTDQSLAGLTPRRVYVSSVLKTWTPLSLTGEQRFKCTTRTGRELTVYTLTGWIRYLEKAEADGDWHIELTAKSDSPRDSCIVAEIPPTSPDGLFGLARDDLDRLLAGSPPDANGRIARAVRIRIIGPAFFDGEHRGAAGRRDSTDGSHGHCNLSARALWEIHPVYWVRTP